MELDNQLMDRLTVNQSDIEVGNELDKGTGEGQASIPAAEDQDLSLLAHRPAVLEDDPWRDLARGEGLPPNPFLPQDVGPGRRIERPFWSSGEFCLSGVGSIGILRSHQRAEPCAPGAAREVRERRCGCHVCRRT